MQKACNLCNTLSREEAQSACAHTSCPHKEEVKQVFIVLTEQDLIDSPELVEQGYKKGDHLFADNAGNTALLTPPEPHLPAGGAWTKQKLDEVQQGIKAGIPGIFEKIKAEVPLLADTAEPAQGDPGDEQPTKKKIIGFLGARNLKSALRYITGK